MASAEPRRAAIASERTGRSLLLPTTPRSRKGVVMSNDGALPVMIDSVSVIRRAFGPKMSGEDIATQLVRDLILLESLPVHVHHIDGWWLVASARDWLLDPDGSISLRHFTDIVHFPEAGRAACHNEILLTAFADAVVTRGAREELTWISGDGNQWALPPSVLEHFSEDNPGRVVAFSVN